MAEGKKSFVAYSDWKETFDNLPNEYAGMLIKHIFAYVNDENPVSNEIIINAVFPNIKNTLKRDLEKWDNQIEQRRNAGKKSAELRATKSNERSIPLNETERNPTVSVSDSVNVSVTVNDILLEKETKENPLFESFWNAYDKKVEKVKCEIKFNKLAKKDIEKIFEALPIYIKSTPDIQFRKNPLTWLNGKCWNDELSVAPESKPKPIYTMASPIL